MAIIKMLKGEKYTFGKINNYPVLVDSTDNATSGVNRFHGPVKIDSGPTLQNFFSSGEDNGFTGVPLRIRKTNGAGEMINLTQNGPGDCLIKFYTFDGSLTNNANNTEWVIGVDASEDSSFRFQNETALNPAYGDCPLRITSTGIEVNGAIEVNSTTGIDISGNEVIMNDGAIRELREVQMQDWDDNTNTNDTTRLLRRDGCWMFYNGAVALGGFGNDYDGGGVGPSNASSGTLVVKDRIFFPKKSASGNQSCISIGIDGEKVAYGLHWFDDDDSSDQRAYVGYSADTNKILLQQHRYASDGTTSIWPSFQFDNQGDATMTGALSQNSDSRLKENVVTISNSLDTIKQLRGVSFDWNNLSSKSGRKDFGLIAQEVEAVIPELVLTSSDTSESMGSVENPDGTTSKVTPGIDNIKSLSYATLAGHFVEAIKEQQTIIEDLKARIETLEKA